MRDCRHRVLIPALALTVAALSSCSNGKTLNREEARSEIRSAVSLTAESELFVDFVRGGHATHLYAEGHAGYLDDAVKQAIKDLEGATPEASVQNAVTDCITQLEELDRELSGMHAEFNSDAALASARNRMSDIRKALQRAQSNL